MKNTKLGFIGCGNMGQAILKSLLEKKMIKVSQVTVCEKDAKKRASIKKKFKVQAISSVINVVERSNIIILAIKPQDSQVILEKISPYVGYKKYFISIMAGVKLTKIEESFVKGIAVARVMPNMAASIGESVSSLSFNKYVSVKNKKLTNKIFSVIGEVYEAPEKKIDIITALSGSGPAYFFYMIESFVEAGVKNGLTKSAALKLMVSTMKGSALVLEQTKLAPEKLREMVTSKKGTTEAALDVMKHSGLKKIIKEAVTAAKKRSQELSK